MTSNPALTLLFCLLLTVIPSQAEENEEATQPDTQKQFYTNSNPYGIIISRNVFALCQPPPPPPPPTNNTVADNAGGLKLTGFIKSGNSPIRALFVSIPSNPTNTIYYSLTEGERDGNLELIKINTANESVDVIYLGNQTTVQLKDNKNSAISSNMEPDQQPENTRRGLPNQNRPIRPPIPTPGNQTPYNNPQYTANNGANNQQVNFPTIRHSSEIQADVVSAPSGRVTSSGAPQFATITNFHRMPQMPQIPNYTYPQ